MHNRQRQSFKMTVGEADFDDDDAEAHQHQRRGEIMADVPPARPIRTTSYLASSSNTQMLQQQRRIGKQLGTKDLIIRMLAEIFQVKQDENGQVRWQQVSTSLVPISLYSRTTSKWLDYLLAASNSMQINDPANTMSPDSRDFLLLLQQFHQQTRPTSRADPQTQLNLDSKRRPLQQQQQQLDTIIFQVVGHDFLDGECRKILNVKIRQPGTRIGQASDYFVYWKEFSNQHEARHSNLHHQQFSASSFASSMSCVPTPMKSIQMLNPLSTTTQLDGRYMAQNEHQTWGLNFASINDAKLFYDICSLNLVDLDFNSEYLKQLTVSDKQRQQHGQKIPMATLTPNPLMVNSRNLVQRSLEHQLQHQQKSIKGHLTQRVLRQASSSHQDHLMQSSKRGLREQTSFSRCPSCKQAFELDLRQRQSLMSGNNDDMIDSSCPVHGNVMSNNVIRTRSRSTTRQQSSRAKENNDLMRSRSFSTPASPDLGECPVHRRRHRANTDHDSKQDLNNRNSQSTKYQRLLDQSELPEQSKDNHRPEKPARGLLRSSYLMNSHDHSKAKRSQQQQSKGPTVPQHQTSVASDRELHTKKNTKTRYMGYLHNLNQDQMHDCQQETMIKQHYGVNMGTDPMDGTRLDINNGRKDNRSLFQKMQTGNETFDSIARRDARMARARYANSKNMKEFLSLDAGGVQSTPIQHRVQQRSQRSQQPAAEQVATRSNTKLDGSFSHSRDMQSKSIDKSAQRLHTDLKTAKKSFQSNDGPPSASEQIGSNAPSSTNKINGESIQRDVSTTTDSLPMDAITKRRMLKLTSEEIISEATEPKSASMSTVVEHGQAGHSRAQRDDALGDKQDRQVRAVSLGPDPIDHKIRGRVVRSEAGRRRSLERSTRIDQDKTLPARSLMNFSQLSPLPPSSASPIAPGSERTNSNGPSPCPGPSREIAPHAEVKSNITNYKALLHHNATYSINPSMQLQDSAELVGHPITSGERIEDTFDPDLETISHKLSQLHGDRTEGPNLFYPQSQMASHKSAPDMSRLYGGQLVDHVDEIADNNLPHGFTADGVCDSNGRDYPVKVRAGQYPPKGLSSLSSYAVPLCFTVKRPPQQASTRQCQSCPNSLHRKRRPPLNDHELHMDTGRMLGAGLPCSCQQSIQETTYLTHRPLTRDTKTLQNMCSFCGGLNRTGANWPEHSISYNHGEAHQDHNYYGNLRCQTQRREQDPQRYCCHHHHSTNPQNHREGVEHQCIRSVGEPMSYDRRTGAHMHENQSSHSIVADSFCQHYRPCKSQSTRPQSSQSVRSPTQYGLYESDCDEDIHQSTTFGRPIEAHVNDSSNRSMSAYFSPINSTNTTAFKPVQGYDQTLARAQLKSRQRSKSQPPSSSDEAKSAFHLSKSMENVEKLIKEVQNELRALKRQPLGTAKIDLRSDCQTNQILTDGAAVPTTSAQRDPSLMVSREEKEQLDADFNNQKISLTSATKRAGQFKCVGAIRKAGFLSVKKWILKRRQSIELARKQGWKRYWVCLRGTALLFHSVIEINNPDSGQYGQDDAIGRGCEHANQTDLLSWILTNCSGQLNMLTNLLQSESNLGNVSRETFFKNMSQCYIEKEPRHLIIIDGAIAQPIPEHPRRDFVFCLSTTFGDAYLFQAGCQFESDNWISAIHNACAASIARDLVRDEAIKLFETKIKHFELEAEKKLFLRQRLESRLTSMSSMCQSAKPTAESRHAGQLEGELAQAERNKTTMRSLLFQLSQQLLALDTYIEQLHCEVYQLRCYLSSCGAQNIFYQSLQQDGSDLAAPMMVQSDLPHPKRLLMHVSKPTKLLLIKLGVFTVSSFHAYIHARQESANTILQTIRQQSSCPSSPIVELRIRSHSISETLLSKSENAKLANDTENLIELANLKSVPMLLKRELYNSIRTRHGHAPSEIGGDIAETSDDRYSVENHGDSILLNVKMNPSSNSSSIIKQVLKIVEPDGGESEFLNYYLRLVAANGTKESEDSRKLFVTVKRDETLEDWTHFAHIELLEKTVFRLELSRSRVDEEETSAPFGISVEAQLISCRNESLLNVYCSYIEWGSVADKAGLHDEDEFLMINGVPVGDLDLMFVECIIQDSSKLRVVVRSNRSECPSNAKRLDRNTWRSLDGDGPSGEDTDKRGRPRHQTDKGLDPVFPSVGSQIISDEYLTSLVCPPPPARSNAFLRTDMNLIRQKSDLSIDRLDGDVNNGEFSALTSKNGMPKSKSQHKIDSSPMELEKDRVQLTDIDHGKLKTSALSSAELAKQLLQRSERITRLLSKDPIGDLDKLISSAPNSLSSSNTKGERNHVERLKKSILELIETEYAYIRHLETISDHYMSPLSETGFLEISDLRAFNEAVLGLLRFQHIFFAQFIDRIFESCHLDFAAGVHQSVARDDFERFNKTVQHIESIQTVNELEPLLASIAGTFLAEAEKFKIYAPYCVAYSKLQRILHPKSASKNLQSSALMSTPTALNTFSTSVGANHMAGLGTFTQQRDIKLLSFGGGLSTSGADAQLKRLGDFLGSLDSSSSSASFSLPRSSSPGRSNSKATSIISNELDVSVSGSYQKSVHQQNFESYLIKPIQRIVKYPMLLNSIVLTIQSQTDQQFYHDLLLAIRQMESVINHVNDTQRVHDEYGVIFDHIEKQFFEQQSLDLHKSTIAMTTIFGPHQPPITLNISQLLYFSHVNWLNLNEFTSKAKKTMRLSSMLFVFESCVVFICMEQIKANKRKLPLKCSNDNSSNQQQSSLTTSRMLPWSSTNQSSNDQMGFIVRYQTLIPVSEVQVRSVPIEINKSATERSEETSQYKWELFQCSSSNSNSSLLTKSSAKLRQRNNTNTNGKVYVLSSQTNEERSTFLRKIRHTIRESVRNMSLPTSNKSPSSNKSLTYSKKLSTSSTSSVTSNTHINSSTSLSPPESSGGPELLAQDQSTEIKCEPYPKQVQHETSIEVKT